MHLVGAVAAEINIIERWRICLVAAPFYFSWDKRCVVAVIGQIIKLPVSGLLRQWHRYERASIQLTVDGTICRSRGRSRIIRRSSRH